MSGARLRRAALRALAALAALALAGCAHVGRLSPVDFTVAPAPVHRASEARPGHKPESLYPLFGDTLIGLAPGTGDPARRYLGRLRDGYTADTLEILLFGDNRAGMRSARLQPEWQAIRGIASPHPLAILRGLVTIPWVLVKGLVPDLALLRDAPDALRHVPGWTRYPQVLSSMLARVDTLNAEGKRVAAVVNTGDLVDDGRYPAQWKQFLKRTRALASRVPYFAAAGNHERTDTVDGRENWRTATGLPVAGDRLYYCFDTADGWLRVIVLDTNPIVDPWGHWPREMQVRDSKEQFDWMVARVREHTGPVIVVMHHPPFSAGFHREEWQRDPVLRARRETMVSALHETGISVIASGHEHSYQRAILTWPDAVLVSLVTGGAGAPLSQIPPPAVSARLYSEYRVAGSVIRPKNVFTAQVVHFVLMRVWFGGGDLRTYAVDPRARATRIDSVRIDLGRYGVPKIDQHKVPIPPAKSPPENEATHERQPGDKTGSVRPVHAPGARPDTTATRPKAGRR